MALTNDNRVYIGATKPFSQFTDYRLAVDGIIVCKRVVVQISNWADDVFDAGYPLMPLNNLQQFIAANHHLPGVPTTAEVLQQGASLDEMNVILLRKVEELTQYVIGLQAEVEALKKDRK